jgi:dTDP-4-amino-4,6-dideoxygalactose transaminase
MPVRATPGFSEFANAHPALTSDLCPLPIAEQLATTVLSLPIGPHLTDEQAQAITTAIRSFEG